MLGMMGSREGLSGPNWTSGMTLKGTVQKPIPATCCVLPLRNFLTGDARKSVTLKRAPF